MFRIFEDETEDVRGGIGLASLVTSTSLSIVGPQGTGKSVLAMHIAARYLADCHAAFSDTGAALPRVCYISTDMTHTVAAPMLHSFGLDKPNRRRIPFPDDVARGPEAGLTPEWLREHRPGARHFDPALVIDLQECPADEPDKLARYLLDNDAGTHEAASIAFVDLAARTAGDDWGFTHRLLGVLSNPLETTPRHLVIIDAIEGLETFGGEFDAFGEASPRRARVAKLIRQAVGKCHLVLIVEEATADLVHPEEFVSDVVIRLRNSDEGGYLRRTLQIEKARGQATVRGRHPYVIRSGRGSTTGKSPNYDDPRVLSATHPGELQSYVQVFPSLHFATRRLMLDVRDPRERGGGEERPGAGPRTRDDWKSERAGFGIEYLDEFLPKQDANPHAHSTDRRGLPCSSITALIGDAGTQKTGLGIAFLGQAFAPMIDALREDLNSRSRRTTGSAAEQQPSHPGFRERIEVHKAVLQKRFAKYAGVPVLITTHNESAEDLSRYFVRRLTKPRRGRVSQFSPAWIAALEEHIAQKIICRRLEIHDMPSAVLFNIIRRTIEAGLCMAVGEDPHPLAREGQTANDDKARARESWRVRVVIDDLATIMNTYAQVGSDPLFLPFLLYHLRREELTSLIIDTRAGTPWAVTDQDFHTALRTLSDNRMYTWRVTGFFGDHRVAIAAIPPIDRGHRARVHEVKRLPPESGFEKGELVVDPVFELYAGLEENKPQRVPLEVRLYGETEKCHQYARYLDEIFARTFRADPHRKDHPNQVVLSEQAEDYDLIRDGSYLKADTWLDHTLIVQVDEFWRVSRAGGLQARRYLGEDMSPDQSDEQLDMRDPYHTYREWDLLGPVDPRRKASFFDVPGYDVRMRPGEIDRVPYLWDFAFLSFRSDAWSRAESCNADVREIWEAYGKDTQSDRPTSTQHLGWRTFLKAACTVARVESEISKQHVRAFDLSAISGESFSCLVLEVWLSEIFITLKSHAPAKARNLRKQLARRSWNNPSDQEAWGLQRLLRTGERMKTTGEPEGDFPGWSFELYLTWLLLVEALDPDILAHPESRPGFATDEPGGTTAVAVRHWYKTACAVPEHALRAMGRIRYGRLPGTFATRGDWFLAVAPASRSQLLARRALDLLCSTRGNRKRLEWGVGLPTRQLVSRSEERAAGHQSFLSPLRIDVPGEVDTHRVLTYEEIRSLGSRAFLDGSTPGDDRLHWLWRSELRNYHRHQSTWLSWLRRMGRDWAELKVAKLRNSTVSWQDGFEIYDKLRTAGAANPDSTIAKLETFNRFPAAIRALQDELSLVDASASR